jgi:hypothetical protein
MQYYKWFSYGEEAIVAYLKMAPEHSYLDTDPKPA